MTRPYEAGVPLARWVPGRHIHSVNSILARGSFLRCRTEAIEASVDSCVSETDRFQCRCQLCLRQSTGDSTAPKIDIAAGLIIEWNIYSDVRDLQAASEAKYAPDLRKRTILRGPEWIRPPFRPPGKEARRLRVQGSIDALPNAGSGSGLGGTGHGENFQVWTMCSTWSLSSLRALVCPSFFW